MLSANIYSTTQSCVLQIFRENHGAHLPPCPHCPWPLSWGTLPGGAQGGIMNEEQGSIRPGRRAEWVTLSWGPGCHSASSGTHHSARPKWGSWWGSGWAQIWTHLPLVPKLRHNLRRHTRPSQETYPVTMTLELGLSLPSPFCSKSFSVTFQFHHRTVSLIARNSDLVVSAFSFWWYFISQWVKATFGSCFNQELPKVAAPSFTPSFVFTTQVTTNEGQTASWQSVEVKISKSLEKRKVRREVESSRWKPLNSNHALQSICICARTACPHWLTTKQQ